MGERRHLLFLNYFDLFIDHLPGESIDRNVHPVLLLAFHDELLWVRFSRRIARNGECVTLMLGKCRNHKSGVAGLGRAGRLAVSLPSPSVLSSRSLAEEDAKAGTQTLLITNYEQLITALN